MSDSYLAAIVTPIATVLFGGVVSSLVTHYMTIFRMDKEYRLKKLEELYGLCGSHFKLSSERIAISSMAGWQNDPIKSKRHEELYHRIAEILIDIQRIYDIYFEDMAPRFMEWNRLSERARTLAIQLKSAKDQSYMNAVLEREIVDREALKQFQAVIQDIKDKSNEIRYGWLIKTYRKYKNDQRLDKNQAAI